MIYIFSSKKQEVVPLKKEAYFPDNVVFVTDDAPKVSSWTVSLRDKSAKFIHGDIYHAMSASIPPPYFDDIGIRRISHKKSHRKDHTSMSTSHN